MRAKNILFTWFKPEPVYLGDPIDLTGDEAQTNGYYSHFSGDKLIVECKGKRTRSSPATRFPNRMP